MKFDRYIHKLLETLNTIPALDGQREVYGYCSAIRNDELFRRFDEHDLQHWDNWENVYVIENDDGVMEPMDNFGTEFTDRDEFFNTISNVAERYARKYSDMKDIPNAVEAMKSQLPPNLPGVYRYFGNRDHGDFWWGFEVDVPEYRKRQIHTHTKDNDLSGLEDLM